MKGANARVPCTVYRAPNRTVEAGARFALPPILSVMGAGVAAIVPSAGAGRRFGGRTGKPLVRLCGAPMLIHALRALQRSPLIRWIIVVTVPGDQARVRALLRRHRISKALPPCRGGSSRAASVARGAACLPKAAQWVLIHDGARPCLSPALIRRCVVAARRYGAAACGLPATLTVKAVDRTRRVRKTLEREALWFVQTPQAFRREWLLRACARGRGRLAQFPDDAALVESAGYPVRMVPGDPLNIKVTTRDDLILADAILRRRRQKSEVRRQKAERTRLVLSDL